MNETTSFTFQHQGTPEEAFAEALSRTAQKGIATITCVCLSAGARTDGGGVATWNVSVDGTGEEVKAKR